MPQYAAPRFRRYLLLTPILFFFLLTFLSFPGPILGKGATIWGADRKETMKAMRAIKDALGVRCKHCHTRSNSMETPNKEIARSMHYAFVDSLIRNGEAEFFVDKAGTRRAIPVGKRISAQYRSAGDDAGIHLRTITADSTIYEQVVSLSDTGTPIDCATCHNGQLYFMTAPKK